MVTHTDLGLTEEHFNVLMALNGMGLGALFVFIVVWLFL
jgi:hypothetical protein